MSIGVAQLRRQHQVLAAIDTVTAALTDAADVAVWPLRDEELLRGVEDIERELARLAALQLRLVREIDGRNLAPALGATSTAALLRARLRIRPGDAHTRVSLAAAVDGDRAVVGQALADGTISTGHAEAIVRALGKLPTTTSPATVAQAERFLVEQAVAFADPGEITRLGVHLRHQLAHHDPDGGGEADGPGELWLTDLGNGRTRVRGTLDADTSAKLRAALDPLAAPRPAADGVRDIRTAAQRTAEALGELAVRVMGAGRLPVSGGVRPHVTVTATLGALLGEAGAPAAETDFGLPLPAATLARLCCDADITRVLLGPAGVPLDVGRETRIIPAGLRRALIARDRCCAFPGCDRPPAWCECHHIVEWGRGGETKLDNLVLLCGVHHAAVHHRGWVVRIAADGFPEFIPPVWVDPLQRPRRNPHCRTGARLFDPGWPGPPQE